MGGISLAKGNKKFNFSFSDTSKGCCSSGRDGDGFDSYEECRVSISLSPNLLLRGELIIGARYG
jgi:hypothetical protein